MSPQTLAQPTASPAAAPATTPTTGAVATLQALVAEGVDTIFGYPGGAVIPIYDALYDFEGAPAHG
jgi:acetolactate synthase-1/2/3 large subunit